MRHPGKLAHHESSVCLQDCEIAAPYDNQATEAMMARMTTHGVMRAIGNPGPGYPSDAPRVDRARRAHMNAIENLAVFAPLVLVAAIIEASTKATVLSAQIYVAARLAHHVIYTAGIPVVRTLAFLIGACATLVIAIALLHSGTWTAIPDRDLHAHLCH
jgi:uncharacterized MAPEG superfamily protein